MATETQDLFAQTAPLSSSIDPVTALAEEQDNLVIVKEARANTDLVEFEAYSYLKGQAKLNSLTATTLRGDGRIAVRPLVFYTQDQSQVMTVVHLGKALCGHDGIIHGGLLATLLDEVLALVAIPALPNYTGFTANLNINYRQPVRSDQWLVIRGRLDRVEGRKAYVEAWIESLQGETKFAEATSLYISPKSS